MRYTIWCKGYAAYSALEVLELGPELLAPELKYASAISIST
jgi:hypothetical protein